MASDNQSVVKVNVARASALKALRAWKAQDDRIDPNNETHVSAYCLARQRSARPRLEQVLAIAATETNDLNRGTKISARFSMVPRSSFVGGVPEKLKDLVVSEDALRQRYNVPAEVDLENYLVFKRSAPLAKLGQVEEIEFFRSCTSRIRDSAQSAGGPPASKDAAGSSTDPPKRRGEEDNTAPSVGTQGGDQPASKKARVLRAVGSEPEGAPVDDEERQATVLGELIARVKAAVKRGTFYSPDASRPDTVHFWCQQVVESMESTRGGKAEFIKKQFPAFLMKTLLENRVYSDLKHFLKTFESLKSLNCPIPTIFTALNSMAKHELSKETQLEIDKSSDLNTRLKFFDSVLYRDFQRARVLAIMTSAQSAGEAGDRDKYLEMLAHTRDQLDDKDVQAEVDMCRALFSTALSAGDRLVYALKNPTALAYAAKWTKLEGDPDWSALAVFATAQTRWPSSVTADLFEKMTTYIVDAGGLQDITNPVTRTVIDFGSAMRSEFSTAVWRDEVVIAAAQHRLQTQWGKSVSNETIDALTVGPVAKTAVKLLSKLFGDDAPEWFSTMKTKRKAAKEEAEKKAEDEAEKKAKQKAEEKPKEKREENTKDEESQAAADALDADDAIHAGAPDPEKEEEEAAASSKETAQSAGKRKLKWSVGDTVAINSRIKCYNNQRATIETVLKNRLDVRLTTGSEAGKVWRCQTSNATLMKQSEQDPAAAENNLKDPLKTAFEKAQSSGTQPQMTDEESKNLAAELFGEEFAAEL